MAHVIDIFGTGAPDAASAAGKNMLKAADVAAQQSIIIPSGIVLPFAGASVPEGFLDCNAAAVSRTTYANLFTAVGTAYGGGDGGTTFNLPDFRGRSILGEGTGSGLAARARGDKSGAEAITLAATALPQHTHAGGGNVGAEASHSHAVGSYANGAEASHTHATGSYAAATNSNTHTHTMSFNSGDIAGSNHRHNIKLEMIGGSGSTRNVVSTGGTETGDVTSVENANHYHAVSGTSANNSAGANHDHSMSGSSAAGSSHNHTISGSSAAGSSHTHSDPTTGNNAAPSTTVPTLSPFGVAKYIIKT
jgi:microcystin-dependent protein